MADQVGYLLLVGASGRACGAAAIQAKKACLPAPHSLFCLQPPHILTTGCRKTTTRPHTRHGRPFAVMADLIGHLPPRGIIPAYPSWPFNKKKANNL